jgi:hypothetical protein
MKTIYLLFLLLFTGLFTRLFAQSRVVRKVESMRDYLTSIHHRTMDLEYSKYAQCLIENEYETDSSANSIDTFNYAKLRLLPPQYDSISKNIKLFDAYPIFELANNRKAKSIVTTDGRFHLLPPLYAIKREQIVLKGEDSYFIPMSNTENCLSQNPDNCLSIKYYPLPDVSIFFYKKEMLKPARIVNAKNDTIVLAADSPYFQYFKKKIIPEKVVPIRYYTMTKPCMVETSDSFVVIKKQGERLIRKGGWTEFRKITCCGDLRKNPILDIQYALQVKDFYKGKPNGVIDAKTQKALIKFQKTYKLPIGSLDAQTLEALGLKKNDLDEFQYAQTAAYQKYAKYRWNNSPKLLIDPNTEAIKMLRLLGEDPLLQGFSVEEVRAAKRKK